MRLTISEVRRHKNNIYSVECVGGSVDTTADKNIIGRLCEDWLSLTAENEQLKAQILSGTINNELVKTYDGSALDRADQYIDKLENEVEQLRQRVAAILEPIILTKHLVDQWTNEEKAEVAAKHFIELIDKALSTPAQEWHNPADVAEIERLKGLVGCGCGLCLAHNNMRCPKLPPEEKQENTNSVTITDHGEYTVIYGEEAGDNGSTKV